MTQGSGEVSEYFEVFRSNTLAGWRCGSGEVQMVFLHGSGRGAYSWRPVVAHLPPSIACCAFDLRGHGASYSDPSGQYAIEDYASDIARMLSTLVPKQPMVLVGHSLGARVALALATRFLPQTLRGLVLVEMPFTSRASNVGGNILPSLSFRDEEEYVSMAIAFDPLSRPEIVRSHVRDALRKRSDGRLELNVDKATFAGRLEEQVYGLDHLDCPLLVVRGQMSSFLSADEAADLARAARHGSVISISRAGHDILSHNPLDLAVALAAFLRDRDPSSA